jgi:hypothetical protein
MDKPCIQVLIIALKDMLAIKKIFAIQVALNNVEIVFIAIKYVLNLMKDCAKD